MLDVSVAANIRMYVLVPWESIEAMGGEGAGKARERGKIWAFGGGAVSVQGVV